MSRGGEEAWVTFVKNEDDLPNALVLAKSIRRTFSHRKILVMHPNKITSKTRKILYTFFDGLVNVPHVFDWINQDSLAFAKIYCLSLPCISKCVFLDSNTLVLNNCDRLFSVSGLGVANKTNKSGIDTSLMVLTPSVEAYAKIVEKLEENHLKDVSLNAGVALNNFVQEFEGCKTLAAEFLIMYRKNAENKLSNENGYKNLNYLCDHDAGNKNFSKDIISAYYDDVRDECQNAISQNLSSQIVPNPSSNEKTLLEPIAIVGLSFRFPGANNMEEYWNLMMNQEDAMRPVPNNRWTQEQSCFVEEKDRHQHAGWVNWDVEGCDGKFFGISPAEMEYVDPQQRLLMEVTWEALEDAAINSASLKGTNTGIYTGQWKYDYRELMLQSGFNENEFFRAYMGNAFGTTASRPAHFLGTTGPNIASESGCSSSMVSVGLATAALRAGETDLALAAGVNLLVHPYFYKDIKHLISEDGRSKAFDESADGFARAEGCGVLVLKRLSDAVRDNDHIYSLIRGYGVSQEGLSKSMGTPTVECEATAMRRALANANVSPSEVTFVEAHGTGTPVGDPLEVQAISEVYSANRSSNLVIGSVKSNIGHTESCSGIAGIIKTILSFEKEIIPPHRMLNKLNPKIKLEAIPAIIPLTPQPWKRVPGVPRLAGVSSFGITGTDAHIILQEAPKNMLKDLTKNSVNIETVITVSARSEKALEDSLINYKNYLNETTQDLKDIAFTASIGRMHFNHRVAVVGKSCTEIAEKIGKQNFEKNIAAEQKSKICFLFTGQGSQYFGMGKSLYQYSPIFRNCFDECDEVLQDLFQIKIKEACWGDNKELIHGSLYSQTCIFVYEYCMVKMLKHWGIVPDAVFGHSLGEFCAAVTAGCLDLKDALKLVGTRSILINSLPTGAMIVVKADLRSTKHLIKRFSKQTDLWLDLAAINSAEQTTLAGPLESVKLFATLATQNNVKTHILNATHAFHSRDMDPILERYRQSAESMRFRAPTCEFISGVEGTAINKITSEYWVRHTRDHVNFVSASAEVHKLGLETFIEVGPQPVLLALLSSNMQGQQSNNFYCSMGTRHLEETSALLKAVSQLYVKGLPIDWERFHQHNSPSKVSLPFYPFQREKCWFKQETHCDWRKQIYQTGSKTSHALVGTELLVPTKDRVFQSFIKPQSIPWVNGHKVAEHVILPGAAYVEMAITAGYSALHEPYLSLDTPLFPVVVENLQIMQPLEVFDDKTWEIQTVVSTKTEEDKTTTSISTFSRKRGLKQENSNNWIKHTEAKFSYGDILNNKIQKPDFTSLRTGMKELQVENVYPRFTKLGYNFSNEFQSIIKIFKSDSEALLEVNAPLEGAEPTNYFCHPVTIDAMIQAIIVGNSEEINDLNLPVIVKKFVFFKRGDSPTKFVHVYKDSHTMENVAVLYDKNGDSLALIEGLDFVKTTIDKFTKALHSSTESCLPAFVETWKSSKWNRSQLTVNANEGNADLSLITSSIPQVVSTIEEDAERIKLDAIITQRVIKTFRNLGFEPNTVGENVDILFLMKHLNTSAKSKRMIIRLMQFLAEDGYVEEYKHDPETFTVKKLFPNTDSKESNTDFKILKVEWACASLFLDNLQDILTDKTSALSLLFPNNDATVTAETYYRDILSSRQAGGIIEKAVENVIKARELCKPDVNVPLRILEIGGGTASATLSVLNVLNKYDTYCIYDFTDISSAFFENGKNTLHAKNTTFHFKMLDIEGDPKMQGFIPHEYDLVIASNVLHATQDLYETTTNVRHLTKDQGILIIYETFIPARFVDLAFCHLDGYWRFSGNDGRSRHCVVNENVWKEILNKTDFTDNFTCSVYGGTAGVIVAKASKEPFEYKSPKSLNPKIWIVFDNECSISKSLVGSLKRSNCIIISLTKGTSFEAKKNSFVIRPECREDVKNTFECIKNNFINTEVEGVIYLWGLDSKMIAKTLIKSYLNLEQTLLEIDLPKQPKHYLITKGQTYFENDVPTFPISSMLLGMCRSFRTENSTMFARSIDLDPNADCSLDHAYQIYSELWTADSYPLISYRNKTRYYAQLETNTLTNAFKPLKIPRSGHYALTLPSTKSFADLKFGIVPKQTPTGHQIEVQIKAAGLNFRDIFSVLKPTAQFENANAIGADFSGTIVSIGPLVEKWKIGDNVLGCNFEGNALPSHTILEESQVIPLPNYITFAEGATLPCVYATVYHSLIDVGKLKSEETILIHTASGGVGLVAIQVAKYLGANVIATAGSSRKRNYLKSLGIKHVYNSRDLNFAKVIKESGMTLVDMVLNSLTGPGFKEASLSCCKPNARFIEMSKLNVWSIEEVKQMRPDVTYDIVDLTQESSDEWSRLMRHLQQDLEHKRIKPLPNDQFLARDIRSALKHLEKAKQIGKVVLIMPEEAECINQVEEKPQLFNARSTYLITGGLTGIGLEVAKWMSNAGARNLILCGRRPPNSSTAESLEKLRESGCNVVVKEVDVGSIEECRTLFDFIKEDMPPLKGVMHCAGCLSDATIPNQTWEKFKITMNPKVNGGWNLHALTKDLNLEHFVLFSSFTAIIGSPGQSNHVASNTYLDTLAHYRHAQGLPATSINWGQWGEIGVAADIKVLGFVPFSISKGIRSLQEILLTKMVQVSVMEGEFSTWKTYFPWAKTYWETIQDISSSKTKRNKLKSSEEFWKDMDECAQTNLKKKVVEDYFCSILSYILKSDDNIEINQEFQEFGMDSLMMIEFKNYVQEMLGSRITLAPNDLVEFNTVNLLTNKIIEILKDVE